MSRTNTGVLFYLKNPKKQFSTIKCIFCYASTRLHYYERKLSVETKFWNKNTQRVKENKSIPGYFDLNITLDTIENVILSCYRRFINENERKPEVHELRMLVKQRRGGIKVVKGPEMVEFIDTFIKDAQAGKHINLQTGKPVCKSTIHTYRQTFFLLKEFAKAKKWRLMFEEMNPEFHKEFVHFLSIEYVCPDTKKTYKPNSIGKHITNIKTFLNNAFERKLTTNQDFKMKKFKVIKEDVDSIYLNNEEISALEKIPLDINSEKEMIRDLFIIGCHTGLRISDLKRLSNDHIKQTGDEKYVEIEMQKTQKPVTIPLSDKLASLLNKYKKAKGKFFPDIYDQKVNDIIKLVAKEHEIFRKEVIINSTENGIRKATLTPKYQLISNHTARRSFATNRVLEGYPYSAVMLVTGHKTEKAFLRYVKVNGYDAVKIFKQHTDKILPQTNKIKMSQPDLA